MNTDTPLLHVARDRVAALRGWLQASQPQPVRLIETHISWVLLTDTLAYKLKKPLQLSFLDFTTLSTRRRSCEEEVRLNRRLAPSLYLDVVDVRDSASGPIFGGDGPVLDAAVRMRRFPDDALWSDLVAAASLTAEQVDAMAQQLCEFHRDAAVAPADSRFASAEIHQRVVGRIVDAIGAGPGPGAGNARWPAVRAWLAQQLQLLRPLWDARRRAGRVRECHGDLHLANVLQLGDEPTAFDGIEFDDELRWIDVQDDMAFLAMDLWAHGRPSLAWRFLNAYLEGSGDHEGLPLLRFFMVSRALVRAQVMAMVERDQGPRAGRCSAAGYLDLAVTLSTAKDARLAITHGLPGSGKSFVAMGLAEQAGALRVRSDVERKRLFGLAALESSQGRVAGSIYGSDATERTYARLYEISELALRSAWPVVVDAAFLRESERARFATLAEALGVPFTIIDCRAPQAKLRERIVQRRDAGGDASEADDAVLERLQGSQEPLTPREQAVAIVIDAGVPIDPAGLGIF